MKPCGKPTVALHAVSRGTHREAREEGEGPGTDGSEMQTKGQRRWRNQGDVVCRVCPGLTGKDGVADRSPTQVHLWLEDKERWGFGSRVLNLWIQPF